MKYTRNAYGAEIKSVETVNSPSGKACRKVTWHYEGRAYNARTVPGSTATGQADSALLAGGLFRIILNGRHQIILIDAWDAEPLRELVEKQDQALKDSATWREPGRG